MSEKEKNVANEKQKPATKRVKKSKVNLLVVSIALIVFVGGFGFGYFQLARVNMALTGMVNDLQEQVASSGGQLVQMKEQLLQMQEQLKQAEGLSAKQEQLIANWQQAEKGDFSQWRVAEARYLTILAQYNYELTRNTDTAKSLLAHAKQILVKVDNVAINDVKLSLDTNLKLLDNAPSVNLSQLYLKLVTLSKRIDSLPVPATPLQVDTEREDERLKRYADAPWYKQQWHRTMSAIRKIVIVKYNDDGQLPLALPDEKMFLYQNLHGQIEMAMWAALNRNPQVYQSSLKQMSEWVQRYFKQDSDITMQTLAELNELLAVDLTPPVINFTNTVGLFDQYLSGVNQGATVAR